MSVIVIDAGITLRRFVGGSNADEVVTLINHRLRQGDTFIAPQLIAYEVTSVLHKAYVRTGMMRVTSVARVLSDLLVLVTFRDDPLLWVRGVEIAGLTKQRNAYDAQCLALAEREKTLLWTADKEFYDAAHSQFSQIQWIANFSTTAGASGFSG